MKLNHPKPKIRKSQQTQQGVALLTILLLVVAITVVAGSMIASQRLSIRQYELLLTQDQLLQEIKVAEQMATALIMADAKLNETDSQQDVWAKPIEPASFGDHTINISIKDASSKFNINNLYHDGAVDEVAVASFERLLSQVGLEPSLAYAVLDWQDPDNETSAEGGAEKDAYQSDARNADSLGAQKAVTATISNQPFISVDELMSVKGITPEAFQKLKPYITAVPYYLPINLNTADPIVLSALAEGVSAEQLAGFAEQMQTTPATSVDEALKQSPWSDIEEEPLKKITPLLSVSSQAFAVLIDIAVEDKHKYATSIIGKTEVKTQNGKDDNGGGSNGNDGNSGNDATNTAGTGEDNKDLNISAFGTRLWTYRPDF